MTTPSPRPARTIIVDDNEDDLFLVRHLLKRAKIDVEVLPLSGGEALRRHLAENGATPDVIVFDLNLMGGPSGLQMIAELRGEPALADTLMGIWTGSEDPTDRLDANAHGADFFVVKPLDGPGLESLVAETPGLALEPGPDGRRVLMRVEAPE